MKAGKWRPDRVFLPILILAMQEEKTEVTIMCPVCEKSTCPICSYWKNDELMIRLFAENGASVRLFPLSSNCADD